MLEFADFPFFVGGPMHLRALRILVILGVVLFASDALADPYFEEKATPFGAQPCTNAGCWTNYLQMVDLDGDGDLDVVMANANGFFTKGGVAEPLLVYLNDGAGNFSDGS